MKPSQAIALLVILALIVWFIWYSANNASQLDSQLVQELNGNRSLARQLQDAAKNKGVARRLLEQAKFKYPGKSDRWYVEKIIYDLERDRAGSRRSASSYRMSNRELRENIFLIGSVLWLLSALSSYIDRLFRGRF